MKPKKFGDIYMEQFSAEAKALQALLHSPEWQKSIDENTPKMVSRDSSFTSWTDEQMKQWEEFKKKYRDWSNDDDYGPGLRNVEVS